ncbi:response regulator [Leptolyngbya sp. NIES-2104]|uniref:response regulator n=1 Tax=Leptolyngbya sp. NIES-2104 TaxID=1552121 RepID=UPI0006ECCCA1|nr:response regulator [Leptolyngbya sp. NIES-2104]GAP94575.1 two-component response regulator [Leptolyngbya sp. NIES-2104]
MTRRILVIDDEDSIRELACACLEDLGEWETIAAASGRDGISIAKTEAIDAILLDVSMPDMDGFECYELLKPLAIPTILLTAKVLPEDRSRFAQLAIAGVITKPFNPTLICSQIAEYLGWDF